MVSNSITKVVIVLSIFVILGAFLRWFNLVESTSFFYDQGRDVLSAYGILNKDFVLVGPTADFAGIFMGPLWYYLLAALYFIGNGNPIVPIVAISFIDLATIILIFLLGKKFFGTRSGLIASFFWCFGAFAVAYSRTLSNPSTSAFWALLSIYSFLEIKSGKKYFALVLSVSLAILWQLNPATAFLLMPSIAICLIMFRKNIFSNKKIWLVSGLIFLISFLPQILFEIRNQFLALKSLSKLFLESGPKEGYLYGVSKRYLNLQIELSGYTIYKHFNLSIIALILSFAYVVKDIKEKKIFLTFFITPVIILLFLYPRGQSHPHYLLAWVPMAVLALAFATAKIAKKRWIFGAVIFSVFIYFNFFGLQQEIITKDHIAQPADPNFLSLGDQMKVLDYIYKDANKGFYGYHTYNILPYWADENWQYMFRWYGKQKYGYIPARREGDPMYLIYEPDPYLPELQKRWLKEFRSGAGEFISRKQISKYTIERYEH